MSSRKSNKRKGFIITAAAAAAIGGSFASRSMAANATWTGATDTFWNLANWDNAGPYTILAGDALFFGASGPTTSHNDFTAGTSFAGITFNSGAQAFTLDGNDIALTGPIVVNSGGNVAQTINFNITGGASTGISMSTAASTTGNNLVLNGNVSVGTLTANGQNTTALPSNTLTIGANKTLTVGGNITVGLLGAASLDASRSQLAVTGATGSLVANTAGAQLLITNQGSASSANVQALLDLSGLGSFNFAGGATGSVNIGNGNRGFGGLRLANTSNTITVGTILLGVGGSGNGGGGTIQLGAGANVVNANTINVIQNKGNGGIFFDPANTTGTFKLRGTGGTDTDRSNVTIGNFSTNGSNTGGASMVFGTNAVDMKLGTLTVITNGTGAGSLNNGIVGTFSFGGATSIIDVNSIAMVNKTGVSTFNGAVTGNLLMSGGNLTVNTAFSMMNLPAASTAGTQANSTASFSISGGNATVNSDITQTNGLAANVKIDLNGGRLNMTGHAIGSSAGQITLLTSSGTLANVSQINGGTGAAVTKTGSATTLRLEGANNFSAPVTINAGTVALLSGAALPNTTTISIASGAALDLTATGAPYSVGSGRALGGAGTVYGSVAAGGTLVAGGGGTPSSLTFTNDLDLAGGTTLKLTPNVGSSAGAIVVNGAVNTSGGPGSVTVSIPGGLSLGTYTLVDYGTLTGTGFSAFSFTPSGRTIANLVDNTTNASVDLNVTSVDFPIWTGALTSEWSTATLAAPKNWVLNSNTATTTDYIESDSVLFDDSASGTTTIDLSVADVNPGTVTFNNSSKNYTLTGSKAIAGGTGLFKNGSGSVAIANNNTYAGGTVISGGTVQLGTGGTTGSLGTGSVTVNGGNLTLNKTGTYSFTNPISGNGSVSINNAATVTLATTGNTYTGGTTVNSGASFRVTGAMAGTGSITVASGGTLAITGNINNPINSLGGGTIGMGTVALAGDATFTSGTTNLALYDPNTPGTAQGNGTFTGVLHGGGTINILANPGLVSLGTFNVDGGGAFRPVNNTANSDFTGTIVLNPGVKGEIGISTAGFSTAGSAKIIMTSGTFNSGATTGDFSLLNLRNNQGLANAPFGNNLEIVAGSGSFVTLNPLDIGTLGPFTVAMGNLKVPGNITVGVNKNGATANLVSFQSVNLTGGATGPTIFSPSTPNYNSGTTAMLALNNIGESVAGSSIVMGGQTTLVITGNNTYTGTTGLQRGTTRMNGTYSGGGAWSVSSGATLTGTGTINAPVSVASGGILAPGGSIGSISVGALSLDSGSLNFEVGSAGVDRINSTGALTLTGVSTFFLQDLTGLAAGTYPLIDYTGALTGDLTNLALSTTSISGFTLSLVNNTGNTSIDLKVATPVVTASWNVDADGNWSDGGNWTGGTAPNGVDHTATFGSVITAPRTVTVDSPKTVGAITFDNANSYTLAGPGTITLDASGQPGINVTSGSHVISAPVVLNKSTTFSVSLDTSTLAITGNLSAAGKSISKNGEGTLRVENLRLDGLVVSGGLVQVSAKATPNDPAGTSVISGMDLGGSGRLDLTNNSMVIEYDSGSQAESMRLLLQIGRLISSSADANRRLGYGDNSVLNFATFAGQTVDSTSTLIKFTYAGDSNLDGQVDVTDLGNLATNWQASAPWTGGDFDYSGFVDVTDLGMLATNWQAGVGSPLGRQSFQDALAAVGLSGAAVPEPATFGLMSLGLVAAASRRRRRDCSH